METRANLLETIRLIPKGEARVVYCREVQADGSSVRSAASRVGKETGDVFSCESIDYGAAFIVSRK